MTRHNKFNQKRIKEEPPVVFSPEERLPSRIPLNPLNDKQKRYINAIMHYDMTVAIGSAGTSKSFIPSTIACQMYSQRKIKNIVICRPTEGPGKSTGYTPGTEHEKLELWARPVMSVIRRHLPAGMVEYMIKTGSLECCDLHKIKGRTFDDSFVIADEAEDMDIETVKSLTTRIGQNSKLVINGDIKQKHIRKDSGLEFLLQLINFYDLPIPVLEFTLDECVRGGVTRMMLEAFEKEDERNFYTNGK